jgi:queuine/archaeosine tRNA-ribosyltransferase
LSEHNVRFLLDLTAEARASIESGEFGSYKTAALERLDSAAFASGEEVSR